MFQKDILSHHGIIGQKWGIRRFQNMDGSYTEEGKHRRQVLDNAFKPGKDGKPSNAEKITRSSLDISNDVSKIKNVRNRKKDRDKRREVQKTISNMTDEELRKNVNRKQMERQYRELLKSEDDYVDNGRNFADDLLDIAVPVVSIGASAATIFAALYKIKNG